MKLPDPSRRPVPGGRTAVTLYQTLAQKNGLSLVACRLVTSIIKGQSFIYTTLIRYLFTFGCLTELGLLSK